MNRPRYSESDSWSWWNWAIFVGAVGAAAWAVVGDFSGDGAGPMGLSSVKIETGLGLAIGLPVLFLAIFGKLALAVYPQEVRALFGSLGWIHKTVALEDISAVEGRPSAPSPDGEKE